MNPNKSFITLEIKGYGWKTSVRLDKKEVLASYEKHRQEQIVYHGVKVTIRQFLIQQMAYIVFQGTSSILGIRISHQPNNNLHN